MYINQELGANEAYSRAQAKSRWVNPNMSLLFSLNDFKKVIDKKKGEKTTVWKTTTKHRPTQSVDTLDPPPTPSRARGNSTPSSTTRDKALEKGRETKDNASISDTTHRRLADFDFGFGDNLSKDNEKPKQLSSAEMPKSMDVASQTGNHQWDDLLSPRIAEMTDNPVEQALSRSLPFGSKPPTEQNFSNSLPYGSQPPSDQEAALFSPHPFEYPRSSFFATLHTPLPPAEDPRSPPTKGEAPITRSIDDFL